MTSAALALLCRVVAYSMRTTGLDNSEYFLVVSDIFCLIVISLVAASVKNARIIVFMVLAAVLLCVAANSWVIFHLNVKPQSSTTKVIRIVSGILIGASVLLLGAVRR